MARSATVYGRQRGHSGPRLCDERHEAIMWDAVTNQERIPQLQVRAGQPEAKMRLWRQLPGGRQRLGARSSRRCEQNSRTSRSIGCPPARAGASWVDVSVSDAGPGRARLSLTHTAHLSEFWDTYGPWGGRGRLRTIGVRGTWACTWRTTATGIEAQDMGDRFRHFASTARRGSPAAARDEASSRSARGRQTDPEAVALDGAVGRTTAFYTRRSDEHSAAYGSRATPDPNVETGLAG